MFSGLGITKKLEIRALNHLPITVKVLTIIQLKEPRDSEIEMFSKKYFECYCSV